MSESIVKARIKQAFSDAIIEIGDNITQDIQDGFDGEYGYNEDFKRVNWSELSTKYVNMKPPRGRGGSSNPILDFEGDLRAASGARVNGFKLSTTVVSNKMKPRGKGSISVADISSILGGERPHTAPSSKWSPQSNKVSDVIERHLLDAINELRQDGLWSRD